jgi:4-amino-4-deoxychorismate lyase
MDSWVDGLPQTQLPLVDRGLAYGDGLFETIRVANARPLLLGRHLQRLYQSCKRLRLTVDPELLETELQAFCLQLGEGVAKLILSRGDGERGYGFSPGKPARRILQAAALPDYPQANARNGIELFACQTRLAEQPLLAGMKHLNRLEQVLARSEWQDPRYAEGLMLDQAGRVVEGVFSNLFFVCDGQLCTPALQRCGVEGVMRAELLEQARALNVPLRVEDFSLQALLEADEVFLCNSLYGVWPVRRLGDRDWPVGPLTRKLQAIALTQLD